ncbi:MAG: nucleoside hydrolase [Bacteroidaceae bacterium]|nr:nucleoside hydrolase [Bacteroidaceae bacterium]
MKRFVLLLTMLCFGFGMRAQRMNIIFETDMGNDVDDALAIDMLYKYNKQKRINLMAVMLNKEGEFPPKYIDLLNTWYGQKRIPIGVSPRANQSIVAGTNYTQVVCEELDEKGKPLYKRSIKDYSQLLSAVKLYRKLLAKAEDASVTIVSVGFSTNLALLLDTKADEYSPLTGRELIAQKVKRLVTMAGHIENPKYAEYNVVNDVAACQRVFNEWPTPIYMSPFELGLQVRYPAQSIENDFTWTKHHPIVDSYKVYLKKIEDRPTWDLTAVLYAIDPQQFFNISPAGRIVVTNEGYTHYKQDAAGNHFYLFITPEQAKAILGYFVTMVTAKR